MESFILHLTLCLLGSTAVMGHSAATFRSYFDAAFEATTKCGPQRPIQGWNNVRQLHRDDANAPTTNAFSASAGIFTPPYSGVYQCCMSARCRQGGYCDFTLSRNGLTNRVAAMGTRNTGVSSNGWESFSICTFQRFNVATNPTIQMNLESGGGSDCIEETGWHYTRFSCNLVIPI